MYKYCIIAFFLTITQIHASEQVSVMDLLNKLQENQKNYATYTATSVITGESNTGQDTFFFHEEEEIFIDGDRIDLRSHQWSNLESKDQATPLEDADTKSFMWDGSRFYSYKKQKKFDGRLSIKSNDYEKIGMLSTGYEGTPLIGILTGDEESVDVILRKAKNISVRNQLEKIGEVECYVINAITDYGEYTVWIDPEHGYNVAKARVSKKKGDIIWGKPLGWIGDTSRIAPSSPKIVPLSSFSFDMSNVRFEKINDVWIPIEADYQTIVDYGGRISTAKIHHKQTHTDLDPDFKAANAFVPYFPNGTRAYLDVASGVKYIWQNGKLETLVDDKFLQDLDNQIVQIEKVTKTEKSIEDNKVISPNEQTDVDDIQPQKEILSETALSKLYLLIPIGLLIFCFVGYIVFQKSKIKGGIKNV